MGKLYEKTDERSAINNRHNFSEKTNCSKLKYTKLKYAKLN